MTQPTAGQRGHYRVVHLITDLDCGGAQTALFNLLRAGCGGPFHHEVLCLNKGNSEMARRIRELGIKVTDLGLNRPWRVDGLVRLYLQCRNRPVDILHAWLFHASLLARLIGPAAQVPIIVTSRRSPEIGGAARERWMRWTRHRDQAVIAVSLAARRAAIERDGSDPEKVRVIGNGVGPAVDPGPEQVAGLRARLGIDADQPVVVCLAGLRKEKGLDVLLNAWSSVQETHPRACLLLAGAGAQQSTLEALARRLGIRQLHLLGQRDDVPLLLGLSNLLVLPSRWEGMSNAVLEAMASGRAVVASAVHGNTELVVHEQTGLLVPPESALTLAAAISRLLADPRMTAAMGRAGRERASDHFCLDAMLRQTEELYRHLLADRPCRS